jgi:hypothetical protein
MGEDNNEGTSDPHQAHKQKESNKPPTFFVASIRILIGIAGVVLFCESKGVFDFGVYAQLKSYIEDVVNIAEIMNGIHAILDLINKSIAEIIELTSLAWWVFWIIRSSVAKVARQKVVLTLTVPLCYIITTLLIVHT